MLSAFKPSHVQAFVYFTDTLIPEDLPPLCIPVNALNYRKSLSTVRKSPILNNKGVRESKQPQSSSAVTKLKLDINRIRKEIDYLNEKTVDLDNPNDTTDEEKIKLLKGLLKEKESQLIHLQ